MVRRPRRYPGNVGADLTLESNCKAETILTSICRSVASIIPPAWHLGRVNACEEHRQLKSERAVRDAQEDANVSADGFGIQKCHVWPVQCGMVMSYDCQNM